MCSTACGILAPQLGINPAPPTVEAQALTTGLPEKSQDIFILKLRNVIYEVTSSNVNLNCNASQDTEIKPSLRTHHSLWYETPPAPYVASKPYKTNEGLSLKWYFK